MPFWVYCFLTKNLNATIKVKRTDNMGNADMLVLPTISQTRENLVQISEKTIGINNNEAIFKEISSVAIKKM